MECDEKDCDFDINDNLPYYVNKYLLPRVDVEKGIKLDFQGLYIVFFIYIIVFILLVSNTW